VSVTADHQSCVTGNIGVATATPAGGRPFGTAPDTYYTYAWNNSGNTATIDNLEGGTYSVTVTDANSCSVTGSTTIVEKPNPVVAISDVATLCPEIGTTNVAASITTSTTPSYTYTWTNDGSFAVTTTNPVTTTATSVTATVSVPDIATAGCSNTYTLKLQVEDANNCLSNLAEKVITVEDVTAPLLTGTWPANITGQNNCFANADTTGLKNANEIKALFSDCSNITVTVDDASTATSNCGWTWTRTYTIKDACGNTYYTTGTTKPTMSVSGSDQSAPTLTGTWPDNITGQNNCFADADISGLYGDDAVRVLFSDCSTITVTHDDVNTRTDNCGWTITRTYTIKDACDNIYYTSGTTKPTMSVSGSDQNIPALTGTWPANITGQDNCFDHADISGLLSNDAVKTLYTDCSAITVSHTDANTSSDDCDWTITRTYTIKDVCNRTTTNSMSVSGSDQSAPAIIGTWPDNITGQNNCFANADISGLFEDNAIKALFTDCSAITVSHTDANTNTDNCGWTITRTYTIKDACDNIYYTTGTTKPTMTVSGSDQSAPVLTSTWPTDITGQDNCFANADTTGLKNANEIKALFSDCSNITVTVDDASTATSDCGWTWTRTYTIKDACGNTYYTTGTTKPTMSVSGSDQSAPALADTWPDNITGQNNCFANADISGLFEDNAIKALFTDCSAITVTHTDENTSTDNCDWTITRTYTIKDACDNIYYTTGTTKPTMSVSGKDQNPPTYTVPPTITVYKTDACTFTADTTVTHSVPTALADDCSAVEDLTLTYTDSGVITATCTDTIKRTWRLVDVCGNVSVVDSVQLILITDTIKPTIARNVDAYPALGVGSCQYEIPDLTGQVTVADNCTAVADLVITQDPVAGTPTNMNRDVTITVTDKCGNSRSTTILVEYPSDIHVQANPPVICKGQETTLTVYSGGISTFYNYVWDNGIGETLNTPDNSNIVTVSPAETTTYHVEITNDNNCTQGADITVTVKPLPVITFPDLGDVCPNVGQQEVVANIEATTPDYTYTWTSDLTLNGTATGTQNGTEFTISAVVPNDYTVANNCDRTNWIKLHVSDNDALHCEYESTYTIVIKDDVAPQLITAGSFPTGEENMNLCYADRPAATPDDDIKALYTDNCGGFTVEHTTSESGNNCSWTVRYTYTITDLCGNTVDPAPYIEYTGGDTEDPTITCPRNYSLPADADHNYATLTIPVPATADNCEVISVVNDFNSTDDASGHYPLGTTNVVYTVTDGCSHSVECSFTVVVRDSTPPCIGCDHEDPIDPYDPDDPDGISCEDIVASMGGASGTFNISTTNHEDHYHHGDDSWNITYNDNTTDHSEITVVCNLTGATTATGLTTLNGQDFAIGTTTVTWIVTDTSNNTSNCSFIVVVSDNEDPCIGCDSTSIDPFDPTQGVSCESIVASYSGSVEVGTTEHLNYYLHDDDSWNITANDNVGIASITYELSGATTAITAPNTTLNGQRFEIGTTRVTWIVVDSTNHIVNCYFDVVITDDEDPCIGCDPTDPVDPFDPTDPQGVSCASIVDAMGGTTGTVEVATSENLDYYLHNGNNWDITASDNVGVQSIAYSLSGATTAITAPATTLNGQRFEIGTTHVTWTVTDVSGRTSTCEFDVVVSDEEPPCIGCDPTDPFDPFNPNDPQGVSCASIVEAMGGSASTVTVGTSDHLDYYVHGDNTWNITANDNVGVASIEYSLSGSTTAITAPNTTLNGQRFEIGTTLVTWTVTDVSGVTSTCEFTVVVTDDEDPCIGCDPTDPVDPFDPTDPDGISCASIINTMGGTGTTFNVNTTTNLDYYHHNNNDWDITVNDNVGIFSVVYAVSGATTTVNAPNTTLNGQDFEIGQTTVTWTVTDVSGRTSTCSFTVVVSDEEPPCIGCDPTDPVDPFDPNDPQGVSCASLVAAMGGSASTVTVGTSDHLDYYVHEDDTWNITASDNVGVESIVYSLSGATTAITAPNTTLNGQRFEIGTTLVTWTVTDVSGMTSTCEFTVVITDDEDPCIGCDPTDPVDPFDPTDPQGVSCASIVDAMGGTSGTVEVETSENLDYYLHNGTTWDITASDNVGVQSISYSLSGATTAITSPATTLNGQRFEIGTTHVTWTVTDVSGRTSTCEFDVVVSDEEPPCIGCDPTDPVDPFNPNDPQGVSCASIVEAMGGSASTVTVGTSDHLDYYVHGDNTWNITANDNVGVASIEYSLSGATTAITAPNTTLNGQRFEIGTTLVTWTVTDVSGVASTCEFTVVVTDDEPPCIGCDSIDPVDPFDPTDPDGISCASITSNSGTINVNTTLGQTYYQHTDNSWNVTVNDNSGIASVVYTLSGVTTVVNGSNETLNGQRFNIGVTTVTWTVTDIYGVTNNCEFNVNVTDIEPPTISCPSAIGNIACIDDVPPAYATYAQFAADGGSAYDVNGINESSFALLSQTSDGNTCPEVITRTYQIADVAGNTQTCSQTITINDTISPLISGVQPTLNVGQGQNCQFPLPDFTSVVRAMSTDNCTPVNELVITQVPVAGNATMITENTDVTIYVSDACGNTSQIIGHAVVPQPLVHTVSASEIMCNGQTSVVTIGAQGGVAPYEGIGQIVEPAGTYNYTISDVNGCTSDFEVVIPQPQLLQTEIPDTGVLNVACYGQHTGYASVSVTGGTPGYTFIWSTTPRQTTQRAINLAAGGYSVTVTDAKGCTSTSAITIAQPSAALTASFATYNVTHVACYGEATGSATITVNGGTTPYEYSWNTSPVQTTATASNLVAGNYSVTITDANGCTLTKPVSINGQSSQLVSSFSNANIHAVNCYGQATGSATVTAVGGTTPYSYLWNTTPAQTTRTATNLLAGEYEVTVTDNHGCTSVSSVTISGQSAPLTAIISSENTVDVQCYGQTTGSASVTATGGSPSYTYSWNTVPAQSTISVNNLAAGNYFVTVTDTHGCSAVASVTINGQSAPLVASFANTNVTNVACYGESSGSAMVTVTGGTPVYSYAWNTSPVQTAPTAQNLVAGNYSVTVTDNHGCTATSSVEITQYPILEASVSSTGANCGGVGGTVVASVSGGTGQYVYSWTNNSGQTYSGVRLSNVMPGTYNLTVSDFNGCSVTGSTFVDSYGTINAHIDVVHAPGCGINESAGSIQAIAESGVAPFSYNWSASGATGMIASDLPAGAYYVTITDNWGCTANASINLEQFNDLAMQMRSTDATCFGVGNGSASAIAVRGEPPYVYAWSNGETTEVISGLRAGRYTITLTDANMCTVTGSVDIDQPEELRLESNVKTISCHGKNDGSIALNAVGGVEPYNFSVRLDDVTFAGTYMTGLFPGTYMMEVSDANGCVAGNVIQLVEPEEFESSYNLTMPSCFGNNDGSIEITATGGTKPYMYGWDSYYSEEPLLTGLREGMYTISVVDANKCTYQVASITLTDMAGACIKIPDVFTPNGDGINDEWIIENIDMFPEATVYVFNRWGQMMYKGTGNDEPWDGRYRGHFVPAGTYLYIVDLYQRTDAYKGTVTVIY
ncbi:MAG: HYR domain-containing protein, partial [Bacteroidales bacterium]|nr:HYR domain-containing protein [Bacteroidales bacterium]